MNINNLSIGKTQGASTISKENESPFDIDMKSIAFQDLTNHNELITSKSLCTPGCGMTGTGNSFCC